MSLVSRVSKPEVEIKLAHVVRGCMDFDVPPPAIRARYCFSLHFPVSMTYFTPGIVIDVSAMLVANIHFRVFGGGDMKTFAFFPGA